MKSPDKLTDTQLTILSAASQRDDRRVILPDRLRGGAADKVLAALRAKKLIEPIAKGRKIAGSQGSDISGSTHYRISAAGLARIGVSARTSGPALAGEPDYRSGSRARRAAPVASGATKSKAGKAGYTNREIDQEPVAGSDLPATRKVGDHPSNAAKRPMSGASGRKELTRTHSPGITESSNRAPRAGTKLDRIIAILARKNGATIDDLMEATGWLPHTARAALTGLRRRGYDVRLDRAAGKERASVYRIAAQRAMAS